MKGSVCRNVSALIPYKTFCSLTTRGRREISGTVITQSVLTTGRWLWLDVVIQSGGQGHNTAIARLGCVHPSEPWPAGR